MNQSSNRVAIGFRAKTGRAICVVLGGTSEAPLVVKKFEMRLTDPKVRATFQPYHAVMKLPWEKGQKAVQKSVAAIEVVARNGVKRLIEELKSQGMKVSGVGISRASAISIFARMPPKECCFAMCSMSPPKPMD